MEAVNLTHRVERAVLEQRLKDAEQNLAIRDLKLDWVSFKSVYGAASHEEIDHVADPAIHGQKYNLLQDLYYTTINVICLSVLCPSVCRLIYQKTVDGVYDIWVLRRSCTTVSDLPIIMILL